MKKYVKPELKVIYVEPFSMLTTSAPQCLDIECDDDFDWDNVENTAD